MMVTACCGRSLRTGTIIVASMEIIFASISALFYILGLAAVGSSSSSSLSLDLDEIRSIQHNFRIPFADVEHGTRQDIVGALTVIFVVALVSSILAIAFSTFLLLSLHHNRNEKHLKIWLVYKIILLTLATVFIFTVVISGFSTVSSTISDLLSTVMHAYFFWVVYSYWKEICVEKELENNVSSPSITGIQGNIEVNFQL